MKKVENVDAYICRFPKSVQSKLKQIRSVIFDMAPLAEELISYGMPAYKLNKRPLVYFAAYENHIGLYAIPSTHQAFEKELKKYKRGKGSVQFPIDDALPIELIKMMVNYRADVLNANEKVK